MRHTLRTAAGLLAAAVGIAVAIPAQANASPGTAARVVTSPYVAMGDSYSSAAGVNPLVPTAPPACSRSLLNYAHDIAHATKAKSFTDVTCSGATTSDFFTSQSAGVAPQLAAVTRTTRFVTMTIGGNDEGVFADSFFGCIEVSASSGDIMGDPCHQKFGDTFVNEIRTQTYRHLVTALTAVRRKAPHATVVILGYPQILPEKGQLACYSSMPISLGDVPWLEEEQEVLNNVVYRAAMTTGARFINMGPSSRGHDACQPESRRWIEPAVGPVNAFPVHPNATGEAAMARQTLLQLRH
jgi:lysophospholipase L1-like esterase